MPRDVNTDNVIAMVRGLNESNASPVKGLSIPELSEITGLSRYVIKTIFDRKEYGFVKATGRSGTGADTYYHDVTKMTSTVSKDMTLQPLDFGDDAKLEILVHNLVTAINIVDPMNALAQKAAQDIASGGKSKAQKTYFDWFLDPVDLKFLSDSARTETAWQGKTIRAKIDKTTPNDTPQEYVNVIKALARSLQHDINWEDEADRETAIRNSLGLLYLTLKTNRVIGAIQRAEALKNLGGQQTE